MARVIKGGAGGGARPARPATRVLAQSDQKKVIDKALYVARQEAEDLLRSGDDERKAIFAEGKRLAAQAREEAMVRGASTSFARAAEEALEAFRKRADRYGEAADDIRMLAHEIVRKVLGADPDIATKDVERIVERGLAQLRARRRVRIQLPTGRRDELVYERPNLMKAVASQPDLVVEDAEDVRLGFARVVTEVGGALCAEESALDAVARAVNVRESPRARDTRAPGASGATHVGPVGTDARARVATGDDSDNGVDVDGTHDRGHERPAGATPGVAGRRDRERTAKLSVDEEPRVPVRPPPARTIAHEQLPDADVEVDDPSSLLRDDATGDFNDNDDDDDDATRALPAPTAMRRAPAPVAVPGNGLATRALPAPTPRVGRGDDARATSSMPRPTYAGAAAHTEREAHRSDDRVPTGRVQAGGRAATRVLDVNERDALVERARTAGPQRVDHGADDDDELDLYTDAPQPRRR
jgi:flagellar biosynthesis/type III secretory pathway protein FliH